MATPLRPLAWATRTLSRLLPTGGSVGIQVPQSQTDSLAIVTANRLEKVRAEQQALAGRPKERLAVRAGGQGIAGIFWFLPYLDTLTQETDQMRAAYRYMIKSPYVKTALLMKVLSVASQDWQIQPQGDNPDSPRDKEACDFLRHNIESLPLGMPGLAQTILLPMLIDGYNVSEKVLWPEQRDAKWRGKVTLQAVKSRDTLLYAFEVDQFNNVLGIRGRGPNATHNYSIKDFVYSRYLPIFDSPTGMSDLRAAYASYFMADTVKKLRAVHAEKYTSPFLKGTYEDIDQKPQLEQALQAARAGTWMSIPDAVKVEAMTMAQSGESDYKSFLDDMNKEMLIAIMGAYLQVLEGQVSEGRGDTEESRGVTELFTWFLSVIFQELVNKQIFPQLIDLNYSGVVCPRLTLGGVSEKEVAAILANMNSAQRAGFVLSKKRYAERCGIDLAADGDDALQPMQMGGMGDSGGGDGTQAGDQTKRWKALPFADSTILTAPLRRELATAQPAGGAGASTFLGTSVDNENRPTGVGYGEGESRLRESGGGEREKPWDWGLSLS